MSRKLALASGAVLAFTLLITGCAPEGSPAESDDSTPPAMTQGGETTNPNEDSESHPDDMAVVQEETCDWDTGRLDSGSASGAPSAPGTDLASTLIGAWQHTHIDEGSGFEAVKPTTDIRYVFPSSARLLYCQDVQGATSQAENAVDIELDGTEIVLPSPATGYGVTAWNNDTMVWTNNRDGSLYLLKRR